MLHPAGLPLLLFEVPHGQVHPVVGARKRFELRAELCAVAGEHTEACRCTSTFASSQHDLRDAIAVEVASHQAMIDRGSTRR